jgi:hypothetical protein
MDKELPTISLVEDDVKQLGRGSSCMDKAAIMHFRFGTGCGGKDVRMCLTWRSFFTVLMTLGIVLSVFSGLSHIVKVLLRSCIYWLE